MTRVVRKTVGNTERLGSLLGVESSKPLPVTRGATMRSEERRIRHVKRKSRKVRACVSNWKRHAGRKNARGTSSNLRRRRRQRLASSLLEDKEDREGGRGETRRNETRWASIGGHGEEIVAGETSVARGVGIPKGWTRLVRGSTSCP